MSSQETPGASESADISSHLRRCKSHVPVHSQVMAKLAAMLVFRCGQAGADSGRNTASHWVTSPSLCFIGLGLGNLPRIHGPGLQLRSMWQSRWSPGGGGRSWREGMGVVVVNYFSKGLSNAGRRGEKFKILQTDLRTDTTMRKIY